ncbi:MAG: GTPase HflX [Alphaproteobacteria bacterium]
MLHPRIRQNGDGDRSPVSRLAEACGMAQAISLDVVFSASARIQRRQPATLFGAGLIDRIASVIKVDRIDVVIVDAALTPVQQRNLELEWRCKVIDRTGLILEIFGARARTREGRLQVELASLSYQRSRLVRSWTHLERQRGGFGFLGGPGETQIEADRRQIDQRITRIRRDLKGVKRTRGLHRSARQRVPYPVIALVGYTNAGKSTLFNQLTKSKAFAEDLLFATLDPLMRAIDLPSGRKAIVSDTVGFVSDLPTHLVAAFRATLEEVETADLILHVRDISHPDTEAEKHDVHLVLAELGLGEAVDTGLMEALNKIDLLDDVTRVEIRNRAARNPNAVPVSAVTGEGCDELLRMLDQSFQRTRRVMQYALKATDGAAIAWLYDHGEVLARREEDGRVYLEVGLDAPDIARFARHARTGAS